MSDQGITTYSVEYREKPGAKCASCSKSILAKSLAASEIFRKSKTEKKKFAKHTWYHFKCWTVPDMVTKLPIEQLRGYPSLVEKDQRLVQQLIERGAGAKWEDSKEKEEDEEEPVDTEKPAKKKEKKRSKAADLTFGLTGVQVAPVKNVTKLASNAGKKRKAESIEKKKNEAPKEEPSLGKKDQLELESIAKEIQDALKKSKKAKK
ncbi:hypothetical protein O0I10_002157 [Lichtheimia ornata]|uniref:PARP-type domain-containing protein n=1 Tax=Lichtheimia ornata TaxID=688661 RepID=A0AAD7VCU5_9FUNG|nr:uncharacterized protein O0I10_002157 [Lichtheimia ornata]KAJ8662462.1 hypothetical protein O0I10_002157 [Lichtheimia ornata]